MILPRLYPALESGGHAAADSLVPSDIFQDEWRPMSGGGTPPVVRVNAAANGDGYNDAVTINAPNDSGTYVLETAFVPPKGVTAVAFELDAKLPPYVVSSTVMIQITSLDRITTLHQTACVLSNTLTKFTTGPVSVIEGTFYIARVVMGTGLASNPASALVAGVRVKPTTASDSFYTSGFMRYAATQGMLWDNGREGMSNQGVADIVPARRQSAFSRFVFRTNATKIGVQQFNSVGPIIGGGDHILVIVNGRVHDYPIGKRDVHDVSLITLPDGMNTIELVTSIQAQVTGTAETYGNVLLGVLVPKTNWFEVVPPPHMNRVLIVGDSKSCGAGASIPHMRGWPAHVRRALPSASVASEAVSSKRFFDEATTDASLSAYVRRLARYLPTKIVIDLGRNDQATGAYPVATFKDRYGLFLDSLHAAIPYCVFYLMSSFPETTESANVFGDVLQDYRDAVKAIAADRSWTTFLDSTTIPGYVPSLATDDGVHPNDAGHVLIATWLLPYLRSE